MPPSRVCSEFRLGPRNSVRSSPHVQEDHMWDPWGLRRCRTRPEGSQQSPRCRRLAAVPLLPATSATIQHRYRKIQGPWCTPKPARQSREASGKGWEILPMIPVGIGCSRSTHPANALMAKSPPPIHWLKQGADPTMWWWPCARSTSMQNHPGWFLGFFFHPFPIVFLHISSINIFFERGDRLRSNGFLSCQEFGNRRTPIWYLVAIVGKSTWWRRVGDAEKAQSRTAWTYIMLKQYAALDLYSITDLNVYVEKACPWFFFWASMIINAFIFT